MLVFFNGCSNEEGEPRKQTEPEASHETQTPEHQEVTNKTEPQLVAENLQTPWEIVLYDNVFYVSERTGTIVTIKDGNQIRKKVQLSKDLANQPEAGLLGIAFPDNFAETKTAFAYYSYQENNDVYQRVVTIQQMDNHWKEVEVLIDHIPGGQFHQGGRLEIGPDNKLYITTGDATNPELAQDLDSLAGKVLRMNLDGSMPNDNPFKNSFVFTYGHRNPQGLAWDNAGNLYATEHGSDAYDEINRLQRGHNYGWPVTRGDKTAEGMETPVVHSGENTWAPSGMTYLDGDFYFASLRGEGLRKFNPNTNTVELIVDNVGRVRDTLATGKGIYIITNNTDGRGSPTDNDDRLLFLPLRKSQS
ncbi:PQQ-dependent sugar dehydrogenase [Virgibacillus ndiopensis]|uniref:PQQ-dependent sugar dehydrogenase n=1 Tax=Virgibacillus ndiopensis TaxID=2004408 RepID=UPI001FECDDE8|nr:PQQ-dependent sugar dehydrogenase [Virgibacillus ndiopensis]